MTGLVRKATLISVCGLLAASAAFASVPDPTQCLFPSHINMAGNDGTSGDASVQFTVTVKDLAGNAIPNSVVVVDLSGALDLLFCEDQLGNSTSDCPTMTVRQNADAGGVATFRIIGGATQANPLGSPAGHCKIYADGVLLTTIDCGAYDLDNATGVGGADLAGWLDDFGNGNNALRADYDGDANVGGADLASWLDVFGNGGSGLSCADLSAASCGP